MIAIPVEDGRRSVLFQTSLHVRLQSKDADSDSDDLIGDECDHMTRSLRSECNMQSVSSGYASTPLKVEVRKYFSVLAAR
jgi:hypothetical protein